MESGQPAAATESRQSIKLEPQFGEARLHLQAATSATNTGAKKLRGDDTEGSIEQFRAALKL